MKTTIQDKTVLVNSVFSKVYKKYDLMNDIMSLGVHRIWKNKLIDWMNPQPNDKLIDVASGTGDIAKLFSKKNNKYLDLLFMLDIFCPIISFISDFLTLYLKFGSLISTPLMVKLRINFSRDLLTTSTSGNSGI